MLAAEELDTYNDVVSDAFLSKVITVGSILRPWIPWLERAILSYDAIYRLHPEMHCTRKAYNMHHERLFTHFEAVRFGHPHGWHFIRSGRLPVPRYPTAATPAATRGRAIS